MVIVQSSLLWALIAVLLIGALCLVAMTIIKSCEVIQLRDAESRQRFRELKRGGVDRQRTKAG